MRFPALLLIAALMLPMNEGAREALGQLTNLQIYQGTWGFPDGLATVGIKALGHDQFRNIWPVKVLLKGGLPVMIEYGEPRIDT